MQSLSNELGRLLKRNDAGVSSTDSIEFIASLEVPTTKKVTYANLMYNYRPLKSETHRICMVIVDDELDCFYDAGSSTKNLLETKILLKNAISDVAWTPALSAICVYL